MARKVRLYWDNEWDGGTVDALSEETDFPATNTQHIWRKRIYRSTDVVAEYLRCDLGAAGPAINTVIIENHNIDAGATLQLIGSDAADGTGNTVTINLTITADRIIYTSATDYTRRYWRISMAGGAAAYFEVGRVFLGDYYEFAACYKVQPLGFIDPSERIMSDAGQVASNQQDRYKRFSLVWAQGAIDEADFDDFYEIYETVGTSVPYWITYDSEATAPDTTYYVLNEMDWSFEPLAFDLYGFSLAVEEAR
jgi:hypothetical protein